MQYPNTDDWTSNHYLAFLALYGANADAQVSDEELDFMKKHFGESELEEVGDYFSTLSDAEVINTIYNLRNRFFPGEDSGDQILEGLKAIFQSDQKYSRLEHAIMAVWQKMV